jgi:hypothetical protein
VKGKKKLKKGRDRSYESAIKLFQTPPIAHKAEREERGKRGEERFKVSVW